MATSYEPIWRDITIATGGTADAPVSFTITANGVQVYAGKSYEDEISISDILADFLSGRIPETITRSTSLGTSKITGYRCEYSVKDDADEVLGSGVAIYDWSYDYANSLQRLKSAPINGRLDPRMPLIWTENCEAADEVKVTGYKLEGDFLIGDYNNDYSGATVSQDYAKQLTDAAAYNFILSPFEIQAMGWQWLVRGADSQVFKVVRACHRYALYYVNALGGVDFLLLEGNCSESDSLTRSTYRSRRDTTDERTRGTHEYRVESQKTYTLRTGLLTTEEAAKMHHLMESPLVCLWDNVEQLMIPIVITDTAFEYKTYKSNGRQLIQYTIAADLAQGRERR